VLAGLARSTFTTSLMLALAAGTARAQDRPEFQIERAAQPPKIDGVLDDDVWQRQPLPLGEWVSYNPLRGDAMPADLRTEVRVAYDDRNLYFAFHCVDPEPYHIRTTVARRDTAFNDDWVAISLDSASTGQTAYHLFVNPSGSQMDALNTTASGEQFDADFVWFAAGRLTDDGYVVEIQLPLQTIRFHGGDNVKMGILFFRKISRAGVSYSFPSLPPGQWVFDRHARLAFDHLTQPRLVEALPSLTYGVNQTRARADRWEPADGKADVGLNGKFGITSNITLDGTINPDFSQVESDAFQVEVNQRFPIFFPEKRPFFMEGMGLFNVAGAGGDSNMRTAVHTRRIVDPMWGSKVIGTLGKTTFGVLNALDESSPDGNTLFTIARTTYALRRADYIGAIATDTELNGRHNRAAGGDFVFKPSAAHQVNAAVLSSATDDPAAGHTSGSGGQASYSFETRRVTFVNQFEHYDHGFQMDTAFYNRTGFTSLWSFGDVSFYPKGGSGFWLQRVHPYYFAKRGHDDVQGGSEAFLLEGIRLHTSRQGYFELSRSNGHETWVGQRFTVGRDVNVAGTIQIVRWLSVGSAFGIGPATYYDPVNPFQGHSFGGYASITYQPNLHFTLDVSASYDRFDREATRERIYGVNIVNAKTTYQFSKHFLVRLQEEYDSSKYRLLTDALASYEFVPGTVFHAGYGSLYERNATADGALVQDGLGQRYLLVNRGLFFKASYVHRF
jgi:Domain of unknown function (DUF5916)/Carbohydrate family 9 binding domain-like